MHSGCQLIARCVNIPYMESIMKNRIICLMLLTETLIAGLNASENRQVTLGNLEITIQAGRGGLLSFCAQQSYDTYRANSNRNRSYTFYTNSMLMVFIGTDDVGLLPRADGSRMFHLLPFRTKAEPEFQDSLSDSVTAVLPGGHRAVFSKQTGELIELEGFIVRTSPLVRFDEMVKKSGGVELVPEKGSILIDYGWRTGEIPITQLWRTAVISDGYGNSCKVSLRELFRVDPDDRDEVIFKYQNNEELDTFLKSKCRNIKK